MASSLDFNTMAQFVLCLGVSWLAYSAMCLATNIHRARAMNVPLIILPISPTNTVWIVIEPMIFRALDYLSFSLGDFSRYGRRGWHFRDKATSHKKLGNAWALVTPRETFLHICDAEAIWEIFSRREDFARPTQFYSKLRPTSAMKDC